jgi:lipopolysaccharide transport system permease protein
MNNDEKTQEAENWSLIITPKRRLFEIPIRELIRYRDLIFLFVKRDFVIQYKQTIFGPIWYLVNPILSTIMYSFVFGRLANIGTDGIPHTLFYYSGTMLWTYFTACFTDCSNVFLTNANLFGKVYFPRLVLPINYVFTNGLKILIQFALLIGIMFFYIINNAPITPTWHLAFFPVIFIWIAAIGTGTGIIISSLTTKYRDLKQLVAFALHLAMYATPVVYPISEIPESLQWIAYVNPVSAPIELFRFWFFGTSSIDMNTILISAGITILLLITGVVLFNQNEKNFIDVV